MTRTITTAQASARKDGSVLQQIQARLKVPKKQRNASGHYNFRSCADIVEALKPILAEFSAYIILSDEIVLIGDRYYLKATATLHAGKEIQSASSYAREELAKQGMDASQITGSASSYARKYALSGLLGIDDTDDADTMDNRDANATKKEEAVMISVKPTRTKSDLTKEEKECIINCTSEKELVKTCAQLQKEKGPDYRQVIVRYYNLKKGDFK